MHIGQIIKNDVANGPGIRLSLFVSGCRIHCPGCFQPQTWNFEYGKPFDDLIENEIIDILNQPQYDGITILGGEPFEPENQPVVHHLLQRIRTECDNRNVWMYSGCDITDLIDPQSSHHTDLTEEILDMTDVLVAGPFMQCLRDISLPYRGSSNQKVIDLKASRPSYAEPIELPISKTASGAVRIGR